MRALLQAVELWKGAKFNYEDDKIVINKNNFFQRVFTFYTNYLAGQDLNIIQVITHMLNSGKYIISSHMLMQHNGQMRESSAEVRAPTFCLSLSVISILMMRE